MTTIQLREKAADLKEITVDYMKGEITFTKLDFCLIGAICFLAGVCIGMIAAVYPWRYRFITQYE